MTDRDYCTCGAETGECAWCLSQGEHLDLDWALTQAEEEERSSWEKYGTDDAAPTTERHPEPRPCPANVSYLMANSREVVWMVCDAPWQGVTESPYAGMATCD